MPVFIYLFSLGEFWEVNDRGAHLDFLTDDQKNCLGSFFGRVLGLFFTPRSNRKGSPRGNVT